MMPAHYKHQSPHALPPGLLRSAYLETTRCAIAAAPGGTTKTKFFISMCTVNPLAASIAVLSLILLLLSPTSEPSAAAAVEAEVTCTGDDTALPHAHRVLYGG